MNRREYNKQETKRHIKTTFLTLYENGGIDSFTTGELCNACKIAKSTFYSYFDDKYDVLDSIEIELLSSLKSIFSNHKYCNMTHTITEIPSERACATVFFIKENALAFRALLGKHGDPRFVCKWKKDIIDSFIDILQLENADSRNVDIACTIFSSSLIGLYTHLLFDMPDVTNHELSCILTTLLKHTLSIFHSLDELQT